MHAMCGIQRWGLPVPFYFLELLIGFVQAFVFTLLVSVYIGLICNHGDDEPGQPAPGRPPPGINPFPPGPCQRARTPENNHQPKCNTIHIIAEITGSLRDIQGGLGCFGAAIGVGLVGTKAAEAVGRNPGASGKILVQAIIGMALAEAVAFYASSWAIIDPAPRRGAGAPGAAFLSAMLASLLFLAAADRRRRRRRPRRS